METTSFTFESEDLSELAATTAKTSENAMEEEETEVGGGSDRGFLIKLDCWSQVNFKIDHEQKNINNFCDSISDVEKATQATYIIKNTRDFDCQTPRQEENKESKFPFYAYDDKKYKAMCGVKREFVSFVLGEISVLGKGFKESKLLSPQSKMTLLFMKFRLNLPFTVLAAYHDISETSAKRFFYEALDLMYSVAQNGLIWFDRATIKARMPTSFKALYPNARAIIDCSEIECESVSGIKQQVQTYSSYKSRNTVKFLIACAPSGEVTFCSKMFGGRTTDTHITTSSGFLDLLEEGDVILSDKGFPLIETDLNKVGCILVIPPFRKGSRQFSSAENKEAYQCAKVRIHVERCIERLKRFEIMTFVPYFQLPHMDKILACICFTCNCFPDLIQENAMDNEVIELP